MRSRTRWQATLSNAAAAGAHEPIAIVGLGSILPGGCVGPEALWQVLAQGVDLVAPVPADRWSVAAHYDPDASIPGKTVTRWGGFLSDIRAFDAAFFGISPREAALIDPQQRLLLQVTWEALEDAGIPPDSLAGSATGVYIGISNSDYHAIQKLGPTKIDVHTGTGGALSIAANRISHRLDLRGPSLAIDTACSSALVAFDAACRALWSGECTAALAGGVNVMLTPEVTISFSRASMLSPDGRCMAFDARANGYVRGEGAGMIVLKPLAAALAAGDRIHAVVRATAVNQDGHTSTITVPSQAAQEAMLRQACRSAGVAPEAVGYVEAHGTGTAVGDPIEAAAIGNVFGRPRRDGTRCLVGSIKTNIGHLESAAGVAGLVKAVLCLRHGAIPPNLHFVTANPNIAFDELGIAVPTALLPWPERDGRRVAAVNSFGFGGTNACALLEAWPAARPARRRGKAPRRLLVPLSAASPTALATLAGRLGRRLEASREPLAAVAATLAHRRQHLEHRLAVVAGSRPELARQLAGFARGETVAGCIARRATAARPPAFVFTGQGAQWWAMGRGLLTGDAVFRAAMEACDRLFHRLSGWSLIEALMADEAGSRMGLTMVAQPTMFALQVALAERWRDWGIEPAAVVGHSIGEIAAAHVCGGLDLADAVTVVYHRSRLQERSRGAGGMAAIGLSAASAAELLQDHGGRLEIAAINAPNLVTIAGDKTALDRLFADLDAAGSTTFRRLLDVDLAFHSRQMDPHERELVDCLGGLRPGAPRLPMISTVTGRPVEAGELDAAYWWRNMRQPVLFQPAVDRLIDDGHDAFLEIGPHAALALPVTSCLEQRGRAGVVLASLRRGGDDGETMLQALGEMHARGHAVRWAGVVGRDQGFVDLPGNPWEKQVFWTESEEAHAVRHDAPAHPLLGHRLRVAEPIWQIEIGRRLQPYLADHCVDGAVVFPAAAYVEMLLAATRELFGDGPWEAERIAFHEALTLGEDDVALMQTVFDPERSRLSILSRLRDRETGWTLRTTAQVRARPIAAPAADGWAAADLPPERIGADRFYRHLSAEGHQFGPAFRGVELLWHADGRALGRIGMPAGLAGAVAGHLFHPAILDSCLQVIRGFRAFPATEAAGVVMPVAMRRVRCFRPVAGPLYSQAREIHRDATRVIADIVVFDEGGSVVASLEGFECRRWPRAAPVEAARSALYRETWRRAPRPASAAAPGAGSWLVFADRRGVGAALVAALEAAGQSCIVARRAAHSRRVDKRRFELAADAAAPLDRLLAAARRSHPPLAGIAYLWGIDARQGDAAPEGTLPLLRLAQGTTAEGAAAPPRMWVCSAGAWQPEGPAATDEAGLAGATLSGLCRALRTEHPALRCTLVDVPADPAFAGDLADELLADLDDAEILLRPSGRHVGAVERVAAEDLPPATIGRHAGATELPFALTLPGPGRLDAMTLAETALPVPRPGEVVIAVRAAGLNFRDVMAASGMLPGGAEDGDAWRSLGLECSGIVASVGAGVSRLKPGDAVIAVARGCIASHVAVPEALVFAKPTALDFVEAACVPTAFLTAWHALVTQGRLAAGERVLITAATGGVGLAAIQVAAAQGAEIYATAGSPEKRDHLRRLGVRHVFDSRSLDFADEVMAASGGAGVDVVLNSQPGPFIEKGLSVLAPFGRFLEIGKRDIYLDTPVGLHALRNNVSLMAIDLGRLPQQRPAVLRAAMDCVLARLASGELWPLPAEVFPVSRAAEAFRRMAQARHIGKIALAVDEPDAPVALREDRPLALAAEGTYLVTGGLGGFGLATARWLVEHGARHLVLVGRSGAAADAQDEIAVLQARGAAVRIARVDVTDRSAVESLVRSIDPATPLRGVVHAAMVLDDGFVRQLDAARFARVLAPKVTGAWNLHRATAGCRLDFFVLYSSISALTGAAGQANYAAANRYLDALAEHRRRSGLPALSVAWGAIADAGYLTRREDVARYLGSAGIEPIAATEALAALGRLLHKDVGAIAYARVDWAKLAALNPAIAASPRFAEVINAPGAEQANVGRIRVELAAALPAARPAVLTAYLQDKVGGVLHIDPQAVEPARPLAELGLDSLTSFELKGKIERELGVSVPIARFLQRPSVATLVAAFIERLESSGPEAKDGADGPGGAAEDGLLSHGQEALWFLHRLDPASPAYNLVYCVRMQPAPDHRALQEAFRGVVARHRALRACFPGDQGVPVQRLLEPDAFVVQAHDARGLDAMALRRRLSQCANEPFAVDSGPLVELHQFRQRDGDALLLKLHHLVVDAWSLSLVLHDLFALYFAALDGVPARLAPATRSYADYARWSRALVDGPAGEAQLAYWRRQLKDPPPPLELPTDRPRPSTAGGPGAAVAFAVDAATTHRVRALAAAQGATLFAVLHAAYQLLLLRLSGQRDLLIGTPVSGRTSPAFDAVVGYVVNPVVIRGRLDEATTFADLLRQTDGAVRGALENQDFPFPLLVRALQADRAAGRPPLFQVSFAMERSARVDEQGFAVTLLNVAGPRQVLRGHAIETVGLDRNRAQFDLGFTVEEFDDRLLGIVDYRADLFEAATAERFAAAYVDLLARIVERPDLAIDAVDLAGPAPEPVPTWRADEFPDVVEAILGAARALPDRPAVTDAAGTLAYRDLVARAGAVARALAAAGAGPGSIVAVTVTRSAALPVALLGTLLAGAAFLPLDPAYPAARLAAMLDDAAPRLVLTEAALLARLPPDGPRRLVLDDLAPANGAPPAAVPVDGHAPAYLIYTSGSTGVPAGVTVPRRALANFIGAMRRLALVRPGARLLAVTTPAFDIALLELLLPLALGATVVVADEATARDGRRLARRLASDGIDVMQATPATWAMLVEAGWQGGPGFTALCGGEALPADLAAALLQRAGALWNLYGPTETTIWSTASRILAAGDVTIGRPIANTLCRVLDDRLRPVPPGTTGELCIGGAGLADGYHARPEATAARFVEPAGERLFRTGDLVRQRPDGAFVFLGRRDHQIKLRGFRIEPAEIEAALRQHPDLRAAAVTMIGADLPQRRLVALVVPVAGRNPEPPALRSWLAQRLPAHLVPGAWRAVDALPLTANGKLDRRALAALAAGDAPPPAATRAPRSRDEACLAGIAAELLGIAAVGVDDDLYALGATSLLLVRLVARASDALGLDLAVADLQGSATVAQLARRAAAIREQGGVGEPSATGPAGALPDWRPLALRRAAGEIGAVEAVALAYLPDALAARSGLSRREIAEHWFEGRPSWHSVDDTPLGRIGLVVVPAFAADLFAGGAAALATLRRGVDLAGRMGARCVSLTGLIPAATDHGQALAGGGDGPALTTGHATTAAAMALSIAHLLEQAGRRIEGEAVAFVGLGSIGQATLRLVLDQVGHPATLTLCDLPAKRPLLEALAEQLRRDFGFHGRVTIATASGAAPEAAYAATLLVGATNVPDVVQVARLAPGTLVVDDSFPPCLPVPAAAARLRARGDILFTAGGFVRAPGRISQAIALPPPAARHAGHPGLRQALGRRSPDEITGCILSALLSVLRPDLPPQLGPVGLEACRAHLQALRALGFAAAALGAEGFAPTPSEVAAFRQRFGALAAA